MLGDPESGLIVIGRLTNGTKIRGCSQSCLKQTSSEKKEGKHKVESRDAGLIVSERPRSASQKGTNHKKSMTPCISGLIVEDCLLQEIQPAFHKGTNNKKRPLPCAKQWRHCGCGRLYRLRTGLCACAKTNDLLQQSNPKETTTTKREISTSHLPKENDDGDTYERGKREDDQLKAPTTSRIPTKPTIPTKTKITTTPTRSFKQKTPMMSKPNK